jgi:glycosyltransferase involved in cell wall biosynthesis
MKQSERPPLRVLHVISGDLWAGAEVMAFGLLAQLAVRRAVDLLVVILNEGELAERSRAIGLDVVVLDESQLGGLAILWRLTKVCRRFRPDIVHTHRTKENIFGSLAAYSSRSASLRTVHGWTEFPRLGWRLDKRAYRALDEFCGNRLQMKVVAVSEDLRGKLARQFDASRLVVIHNGIDVAGVRRAAKASPGVTIGSDTTAIGIVARMVPVKRHELFIRAAEVLLTKSPNEYDFHLIGDGPMADSLRALSKRSGFAHRFHMHGFQANVPAILARLDAIVVCSEHEGIPMNVLEAAVLGVPVVATPLPSMEMLISRGVGGLICRDDTPAAIADGIVECMRERRFRSEQLTDAWEFSAACMAARYVAVYEEMLEARGSNVS